MDIKDQLDSLRQKVDGCALVAFADIEARLVLVSSSDARASREVLDALCAEAALLFNVADAKGGENGLSGADTALNHDAEGVRFFVRDTVGGSDVLCCVLSPDGKIDALVSESHATANAIFDTAGDA